MEQNQPRKQGGSALTTFLLVLIILLLSGILVYLRYGDLMMNRLYQFTDGKIGAETGVTSLPGRKDPLPDEDNGASGEPSDGESDELPDGVSGELPDDVTGEPLDGEGVELPDEVSGEAPDGEAVEAPDPEPVAPVLDYAAAKALPDGITLSTHDFTLRTLGESAAIRVTGGSDGPFTWISEKPSVAEVDEAGNITARAHGTVHVIVTDGVRKGVCVARMITGATSTAAKLNTSDFTRTVEEGEYQLRVSGVEAPITWTSEDDSVATVDANGLVIPVGKGRTRIRAAWDGGYLICVVRVPG